MTLHTPYIGTPDQPLPPVYEEGWTCIDSPDHLHFAAAREYAGSGVIGELPPNHYQDVRTPTGLYRFFHFDSATGGQIGALHFDGTMGAPPAAEDPGQIGDVSLCAAGFTQDPYTGLCVQSAFGSNQVTNLQNDPSGGGGLVDGNGNSYVTRGGSGTEPIPQDGNGCTWAPETTNPAAVAIAASISYQNTPVPFADQTAYSTMVNNVPYRFVMWRGDCKGDGGTYNCVSVFRCTPTAPGPTPGPSPSGGGGSSSGVLFGIIAAALAVLGGGIAVASTSKKKNT